MKDAIDDPEPSSIWVEDMSRFGRNNAQLLQHAYILSCDAHLRTRPKPKGGVNCNLIFSF